MSWGVLNQCPFLGDEPKRKHLLVLAALPARANHVVIANAKNDSSFSVWTFNLL
jgi:hypothetical protein